MVHPVSVFTYLLAAPAHIKRGFLPQLLLRETEAGKPRNLARQDLYRAQLGAATWCLIPPASLCVLGELRPMPKPLSRGNAEDKKSLSLAISCHIGTWKMQNTRYF